MTDIGPFKCPDCGTWWAAPYEHCCPPMQGVLSITRTNPGFITGGTTVRCTCPLDRLFHSGACPIHDWNSTYTNIGFDGTVSWTP